MKKKLIKKIYLSKLFALIKKNRTLFLTIILVSIIGDIILIVGNSDVRTFSVLALGIMCLFIYKLSSRFVYLFCLCLLGVMFISFLLNGTAPQTEKAAVWLYLFLIVAMGKQLKE